MSRFVYISELNNVVIFDLADGSLETHKPSHTLSFTVANGTKFVEIWSAEALLEAIENYSNAAGVTIRTVPAYWEEQIRKVVE